MAEILWPRPDSNRHGHFGPGVFKTPMSTLSSLGQNCSGEHGIPRGLESGFEGMAEIRPADFLQY